MGRPQARIAAVQFGFALGILAILARAAQLQLFQGDRWADQAQRQPRPDLLLVERHERQAERPDRVVVGDDVVTVLEHLEQVARDLEFLMLDALDVGQRRLPVQVDAEDVHPAPRQREADGLAESGGGTEDEGPAGEVDGGGGRAHGPAADRDLGLAIVVEVAHREAAARDLVQRVEVLLHQPQRPLPQHRQALRLRLPRNRSRRVRRAPPVRADRDALASRRRRAPGGEEKGDHRGVKGR